MFKEVSVMQRSVKLELHTPFKPEVLKPSNTPNIQNKTKNGSMIATKSLVNTSAKSISTSITKSASSFTAKATSLKTNFSNAPSGGSPRRSSSTLAAKSPLKQLQPIRPSPGPKGSVSSSAYTTRPPPPPPQSSSPPSSSPTSFTTLLRTPTTTSTVLTSSLTSSIASSSSSCLSISPAKCKRRINYSDNEIRVPVSRRNARERNRVKQVSQGFAILRQHVPQAARKKKMSKVETLRCAVDYIRGLQLLLDNHPPSGPPTSQPPLHHHHHQHHHHHHQQQLQQHQTQVFFQPPPHTIESHILKLPVANETFQSSVSLRYGSVSSPYFRPSPEDADGCHSPVLSSYPKEAPTSSPQQDVEHPVIKTECPEEQSYGREEQDLLEALAWWQHNIQS
ncbi:hypothetical protein Pmani_005702 [Petrolisthes manimaculis]|uniref:BHLH domain-containing protein n=1 Tax=Petrolisthes manimaculis TaxID=1843537 RepID=A0AAE1QE18_9EUCA|nr:hypothetical protein Pmani_005702 [Petrolisthes manimaculis]